MNCFLMSGIMRHVAWYIVIRLSNTGLHVLIHIVILLNAIQLNCILVYFARHIVILLNVIGLYVVYDIVRLPNDILVNCILLNDIVKHFVETHCNLAECHFN